MTCYSVHMLFNFCLLLKIGVKDISKNISKNLSSKYSQKRLDQTKKSAIDVLKTVLKNHDSKVSRSDW